jgi:CheY-like chemotaxis protein
LTVEVIRAAPAALWVLFALFAYLTLRPVIRRRFEQLSTVKTYGVEMSFAGPLLEAAGAQVDNAESPGETPGGAEAAPPTASERRGGVSRLEHAAPYLEGRSILWVDDRPQPNAPLVALLRKAGLSVDDASTTAEAIAKVRTAKYDLIITDMVRADEGKDVNAAVSLLDALAAGSWRVPVILFTDRRGLERGVPDGFFAYTSSSDNLVQCVIDVMERIAFGVGVRTPRRPRG